MTEQKAYEQIVNYFSKLVISGRLQTNDRLPSDVTVVKELGVNVQDVSQILQQMEAEGIIASGQENDRYLNCDVLADIQELFIHNFHYEIFHDKERGEALKEAHWKMYESFVSKNHLMGRLALRDHFEIVEEYVEKMRNMDASCDR